jgi:hypothetical protein
MSDDNTRDAAEPSLASAGSQPVGWGAVASDGSVVCMMRRRADVASYVVDGTPIVPLYRSPQPTLTDEEKTAIALAQSRLGTRAGDWPAFDVLAALLERLG